MCIPWLAVTSLHRLNEPRSPYKNQINQELTSVARNANKSNPSNHQKRLEAGRVRESRPCRLGCQAVSVQPNGFAGGFAARGVKIFRQAEAIRRSNR